MATPQLAKKSKDGLRPGYGGWDILDWIVDKGTKYAPILKTGVAALSTYASFKDQQKKNQMQQDAYDDYMAQAEAAGHEARAAIDINYTPMTISGVPTSKADVTDFTAVAARGGLMTLPQRKRYAYGPELEDVEVMDEETITPFGLQQETGIDLTGEQVKYDTGNPRQDAWGVWNSGGVNQEIYEFDFELFFDSGDWMDHISQAPAATGDMQMASHEGNDAFLENRYQELLELNLSPAEAAAQAQKELGSGGPMATGGIAGLRNGGRPGYADSNAKDFAEIDMTISDNPNDPRNMTTVEIISVIKSGRSTPEMFEELRLRGIKDVDLVDLAEFGKDAGEGDVAYSFNERMLDEYNPETGTAEESFLYDLRENNPDVYGAYKEPKNYPEQNFYAEPTWMKAQGGRIGYESGSESGYTFDDFKKEKRQVDQFMSDEKLKKLYEKMMREKKIAEEKTWAAQGGRVGKDNGGIMDLGGMEKDYRTTGGFVPLGGQERADDVPARLSKNEFVMTADAVRAAGGGSINKGAQLMYDTMKNLEARPQSQSQRMIA